MEGSRKKHQITEAKRKETKAIATPIRPEREMCQYEQIREYIIRERKEVMYRFNLYEDLKKTKEDIFLYTKKV